MPSFHYGVVDDEVPRQQNMRKIVEVQLANVFKAEIQRVRERAGLRDRRSSSQAKAFGV